MTVRINIYDGEAIAAAIEETVRGRAEIAQDIADEAQSAAAVETGEFKSSFYVDQVGTDVRVGNSDPAAAHIILGTSDTPPHAEIIAAARARGRYTGFHG